MLEQLRSRIAALTEERAAKVAALEAVTATAETESRALTVEEDAAFTASIADVKTIDGNLAELRARVADLEEIERATIEANKIVPFMVNRGALANPFDLSDLRYGAGRSELRARVDTVLSNDKHHETGVYLTPEERSSVLALIDKVDTVDGKLSRRVLLTGSPEYRRAWQKALSGNDYALTEPERAALGEMRAASLADAAGGFAVPFVLDSTIIDTGSGSVNPFRQISTVRQTMGDNWQGVTSAGVTASWDGEAAEVSDDAPTLAQPAIAIHKAQGLVPFSIEVGMDWANMDADMRSMFAVSKDDLEATAFATGTGSNQPFGVVTGLDGGASEVAPVTPETFAVADLYALEEALPPKHRARASWVANKAIFNDIRQFGTSDSHALWERLGADQPRNLLGYPTYEASAMDNGFNAAATADNFLLILGDFSAGYYIIDRIGLNVELVPHLLATANNRPNGQRGLYFYWRVGAKVVNINAFRMLNVATTA